MNDLIGMLQDVNSSLCDASNHIDERASDAGDEVHHQLDVLQDMIQHALRLVQKIEKDLEPNPREKGDDDGVEYGHPLDREYDR